MTEVQEQRSGAFERAWFVAALLFGGYQLVTGLPDPLALFTGLASVWVALIPQFLGGERTSFLLEVSRLALVGYPLWLSCMWANALLERRGIEIPAGPWEADTVAGVGAASLWALVLLAIRVHLWRRPGRGVEAPPEIQVEPKSKIQLESELPSAPESVQDWPAGPGEPEQEPEPRSPPELS